MPNVTPELKKQGKKGKEKYMKSCVHVMVKEGKSVPNAVAACLNMWKNNWHKKKSKASLNKEIEEPDWEKDNETKLFTITGPLS